LYHLIILSGGFFIVQILISDGSIGYGSRQQQQFLLLVFIFQLFISLCCRYIYIMKMVVSLLMLCLLGMSCSKRADMLYEKITGSDSAAINYFTGDGAMDTVLKVKIIRDKKLLEQLAQSLSAKITTQAATCGADGSVHFFKFNKVIQDIHFRLGKNECLQCTFTLDGKRWCTQPAANLAELLQ
jgi:hypothetical protein